MPGHEYCDCASGSDLPLSCPEDEVTSDASCMQLQIVPTAIAMKQTRIHTTSFLIFYNFYRKENNTFYASSFYQMINLVCGDPITKIWIANVLFKYDYKIQKIENMVVPVGTPGMRGLRPQQQKCSALLMISFYQSSIVRYGYCLIS